MDRASALPPSPHLPPKEGALRPTQLRACSPTGDVTPLPEFKVQYSVRVVSYLTISMRARPRDGLRLLATILLSPRSVPDQTFLQPCLKNSAGWRERGGVGTKRHHLFIPELDLGLSSS